MTTYVPRVFFTYVWGAPGDPAWPLTFASKAARTHARKVLTEGDLVFTVCTKSEPTPVDLWGRVTGLFRMSDLEVNTLDYDLPRRLDRPEFDSVVRFPYALHPIEVWEIADEKNLFSDLVGPLTPTHHLQAQSKLVELDSASSKPLLALSRLKVTPAVPKTEFGFGRVLQKQSKLAPKHKGPFSGAFAEHEVWYVYVLVLRDGKGKVLAVKVGYSNDPRVREDAHNFPLATEVTGLRWGTYFKQPTSSEDIAREVEQAVLGRFSKHRLPSNGEILRDVDPISVGSSIGLELRSRPVAK